jgi:hypothetical protein
MSAGGFAVSASQYEAKQYEANVRGDPGVRGADVVRRNHVCDWR